MELAMEVAMEPVTEHVIGAREWSPSRSSGMESVTQLAMEPEIGSRDGSSGI